MLYLFFSVFMAFAHAALDARYDDYDSFDLVQVLIDDGKLELAQKELDGMSREEKRNSSYGYLSGVVQFKKKNYKASEKLLEDVQFAKNSAEAHQRNLYLARSYFQIERFERCARAFKDGVLSSLASDEDFIQASICEQKQGAPEKAWATLVGRFQRNASFTLLLAIDEFLLKEKLFNVAKQMSLEWLAVMSKQGADFLTVADLFQKSGDGEGRLAVLEMGRVKYPLDVDINLNLNQIYYEKGMVLAVEEGFSRAALVDGKYAYHAAEINRQAGRYERSQFFNAAIPDEKERLKQKLAIYVDKGEFALIASMEPALQRMSLIHDDEVRYALAYSLVRSGNYERPLMYLSKITNKDLLEKTVILRNALSECVQKNTSCKL